MALHTGLWVSFCCNFGLESRARLNFYKNESIYSKDPCRRISYHRTVTTSYCMARGDRKK